MAKQSNRLVQRIAHEQKESLTTEQLGERVIQDLKQMSPGEKAQVRQHLDKAFGKQTRKQVHDTVHTAQDSVLAYMLENGIELSLESYVELAWFGDKTIQDLEGEEWANLPEELVYAYEHGTKVRIQ